MSEYQNYYESIKANLHMLCRYVQDCEECRGTGSGPPTQDVRPCTQCTEEDEQNCYRCLGSGLETVYLTCKPCEGKGYVISGECGGWVSSDLDTIHKCPHHYNGQPEPEL